MAGWPNDARFFLDVVSETIFTHIPLGERYPTNCQDRRQRPIGPQPGLCQEAWGQITASAAKEAKETRH
eukprot:8620707-Lingulodinium_polyedra.AAC.1